METNVTVSKPITQVSDIVSLPLRRPVQLLARGAESAAEATETEAAAEAVEATAAPPLALPEMDVWYKYNINNSYHTYTITHLSNAFSHDTTSG